MPHTPPSARSTRTALAASLGAGIAALALLAPSSADACTAALLRDGQQLVIAKSYDWDLEAARIVVNAHGVKKRGLGILPGDRPPTWTSRYGSITFNQYGREFPNGGMNDQGLIIEALWLASSRTPAADDRPSLNELQWIQHQLDLSATVEELITRAGQLRVSRVYGNVHYFTCDRTGACAVLEYLDGTLEVTAGQELAVPVLANNTFAQSLEHLERHRTFHPDEPPTGDGSLDRFTRAAMLSSARTPKDAPSLTTRAFDLLNTVRTSSTQWQIVYDPRALTATFRTRTHPDLRTLELAKLNTSCSSPTLALDANTEHSGALNAWLAPDTAEANKAQLKVAFGPLSRALPAQAVEVVAAYPASTTCTLK